MVQIIKVPGINNLGVDYWVTGSGNSKTNGIKTNDKSRNSGNAILNEIKKSGEIVTTKSKQREGKGRGPGGGMGISKIVMGYLNRVGGNLDYSIIDGRIVAEVTWS